MATGVRTKKYNCFKEGVCVSVQAIQIIHSKPYGANNLVDSEIIIDGEPRATNRKWLPSGEDFLEQLAINDGFNNYEDFFKWFSSDFQGQIIHWTDLRY